MLYSSELWEILSPLGSPPAQSKINKRVNTEITILREALKVARCGNNMSSNSTDNTCNLIPVPNRGIPRDMSDSLIGR